MALRIIALIALLISPFAHAGLFNNNAPGHFIPADQAFAFDFQQRGATLNLNWEIKPGYYLYRQQITITPHRAALAPWSLPPGEPHEDEFFGKSEIYTQPQSLTLTVAHAAPDATLKVTYQGCAAAGFCYPPETRSVPLSAVTPAADSAVKNPPRSHVTPDPAAPLTQTASDRAAAGLPFSLGWALLIGIGVAFTPCILPMYPLISGIVLGGKQRLPTGRALLLALVYVQGMALTYTLLGLIIATIGLQFQAALQQPWVLITLSVAFILLALSMFGVYTLQLPAALQTRLTLSSNRHQGGTWGGVFAMGAIAGLICSPCTTAPLSAILLYIAQSGDRVQGAVTLYLYALGMGLPLIAITVFGQRILPKSGPWMESVKTAFGFIILAVPVFLLERVTGETWGLRMWGALGVAFFSWAFITALRATAPLARIGQIVLLGAAIICARPLQDWAFGTTKTADSRHPLVFKSVNSVEALKQQLEQARGKPVMVDIYADWCVACKELEKYTFSSPDVRQTLGNVVLLQANVTAGTPDDAALLKHLQVLGLPTVLFFDASGQPLPAATVTGFMTSTAFNAHIRKHLR